eukprot:7971776-Pyramimonas_sp.AAC.1
MEGSAVGVPLIVSTAHLAFRRVLESTARLLECANFAAVGGLHILFYELADAGAAVSPGFCIRPARSDE